MIGKQVQLPENLTFGDAKAYIEKYRDGNDVSIRLVGAILQKLAQRYDIPYIPPVAENNAEIKEAPPKGKKPKGKK